MKSHALIAEIMKCYGRFYYIGLFTAASMHLGAAIEDLKEIQVVRWAPLKEIKFGDFRITVFTKNKPRRTPTMLWEIPGGIIHVSTREATALDLSRWAFRTGKRAATEKILAKLAPTLDPKLMQAAAKAQGLKY